MKLNFLQNCIITLLQRSSKSKEGKKSKKAGGSKNKDQGSKKGTSQGVEEKGSEKVENSGHDSVEHALPAQQEVAKQEEEEEKKVPSVADAANPDAQENDSPGGDTKSKKGVGSGENQQPATAASATIVKE